LIPGQRLSDNEVWNLIFEPGFSTAEQVTNLSGRGVGMDVVKRNITALRGSVSIDSKEGVGTTVSVRLPLTLAIIDGQLVRVGRFPYVVPLLAIVEQQMPQVLDEIVQLDPHFDFLAVYDANRSHASIRTAVGEASGQRQGLKHGQAPAYRVRSGTSHLAHRVEDLVFGLTDKDGVAILQPDILSE
jgi:chemotaxis protein histidine kinase CheA